MSHWKITRNPQEYGKVAVLLGGVSAEREISLLSGNAIFNALQKVGVDVIKVDPKDSNFHRQLEGIDRAFIALHGRNGEDGVIQGYLQTLGIPYTGSSVCAAAVSMDKFLSKQIWRQLDMPTANFIAIKKQQVFDEVSARRIFARLGPTVFVKPVKEGSSVGMSKVKDEKELVAAVALAHQYDDIALIESFISGKEYTVSVLNNESLPSISMTTPREFYDYEAKYQSSETQYFCPSGLSQEEENKISKQAIAAFKALGCEGWGRVDFIRDGDSGEFLILEANTVPGMTPSSLVPKAAKQASIDFESLVQLILDTSFEKSC